MRKIGLYATWMQHDEEKCWLGLVERDIIFFVRYEGAADDYNVHTTEARVTLLRAIRIKTRVNSLMIRRKAKKKERESAVCKEAFVPLLYEGTKRATHSRAPRVTKVLSTL